MNFKRLIKTKTGWAVLHMLAEWHRPLLGHLHKALERCGIPHMQTKRKVRCGAKLPQGTADCSLDSKHRVRSHA
jgi:hypothetical protein